MGNGLSLLVPSIHSTLVKDLSMIKGVDDNINVFNIGNRTLKFYMSKFVINSVNDRIVVINPETTILNKDMLDDIRNDTSSGIVVYDIIGGYADKFLTKNCIISFHKSRYKLLGKVEINNTLDLQKYFININTNNIKYRKYNEIKPKTVPTVPIEVSTVQTVSTVPIEVSMPKPKKKSFDGKLVSEYEPVPTPKGGTKHYSIIIPFMYNTDRFPLFESTVKCLNNLIKDYDNIELVVHETASERVLTDDFLNKYDIKYMYSKWDEVFHRSWALNAAVKHVSTGNVYVFMDGDMVVTQDWLNELLMFDTGIAIGWGELHNLTPKSTLDYIRSGKIGDINKVRKPSIFGAAGGITVIDSDTFNRIGAWPEDFRGSYGGEDNAMMLKISKMQSRGNVSYTSLKAPVTFKSLIYHLHHNHQTYKHPMRIAILGAMKQWHKQQWEDHNKANADWGKRFFDSELINTKRKLKVLWLGIDRDKRVASHFDDLRNEFSKISVVSVLNHSIGNKNPQNASLSLPKIKGRDTIVKEHLKTNTYDFIVCDAPFAFTNEDWGTIKTPKAVIIEDQHNKSPKEQVKFAVDNKFIILHRYQFNKYHTDIPKHIKTIWFPHSVNTEVFKDWKQPLKYGVLQTGAMYPVYKTRCRLNKEFKEQDFYTHIPRPKEDDIVKWPVGEDYAKELNKARLSICCGSKHQYPVIKFMEIPACKSIVYGDYFDELGDLGFIPGINMIVPEGDAVSQVKELVRNPVELIKIRDAGLELIKTRHTNTIRAKELLEIIEKNK